MTNFELTLAVAGMALQASLCVLIARRAELRSEFPVFLGYNAFEVTSSVAELAISGRASAYFYFFWVAHTFSIVLSFLALYEIFNTVFKEFYRVSWFKLLFPVTGLAALLVAIARDLLIPTGGGYPLFNTIVSLEIAVQFLQMGVLLLFFILVRFFRVRWQQHAMGIALGFGISAAGILVVFLLRSEFGTKFDSFVRSTPPIAYTFALVVWLITFVSPEPVQPPQDKVLALTPEEMLAEIKQYSRTVKRVLKR